MPQPDAEIPDYNRKRPNPQGVGEKREDAGDSVFVIDMGGEGDAPVISPKAKLLRAAEAAVRADAPERQLAGFARLLRDEFAGVVDVLEAQPEVGGQKFHASWGESRFADDTYATLRVWFGQAGDDTRIAHGKNLLVLRAAPVQTQFFDCTQAMASGAGITKHHPQIDVSDRFAPLALAVPAAIQAWANRVAGRYVDLSEKVAPKATKVAVNAPSAPHAV